MRAPYIALLGPTSAEARARLRDIPGYEIVLDQPHAVLGCATATMRMSMGKNGGAIIGTLFDTPTSALVEGIEDAEAQIVFDSNGDQMIDRYWGSYVAVFANERNRVSVIRDPSGSVPCYFARSGDTLVATSDVGVCASLGLIPLEIDWPAVCAHLLWPERRVSRTCIAAVRELMPGCRLTVHDGSVHIEPVWQPWRFTSSAMRIDDPTEAAMRVQRAVDETGAAWSRRYVRPLVSLSGGLDSSIVMAATPDAVGAITFVTHEPLGDERRYAKAVADRCSIDLLEWRLAADSVDVRRSNAAGLVRPVARLFGQELDRAWRATASATNADALCHGGGGDNVFCYLASAGPYLDSMIAGLPRADRRAVADSLSQMTRVSVWRIKRAALRKALIHRGRHRWRRDPAMLSTKAIGLGKDVSRHPWFEAIPSGILPGKQAHVASIIRIQNYLEAVDWQQDVAVTAPLMSQPVIETCLRIPTWLWCRDGMNRVVARDAFRDRLPAAVIDRRSKGSPAAFDAKLVATKRNEMLELLRYGHLAARGFIDTAAIEQALGHGCLMRGTDYLRATQFVDVEAWLQSWVGTPSDLGRAHN